MVSTSGCIKGRVEPTELTHTHTLGYINPVHTERESSTIRLGIMTVDIVPNGKINIVELEQFLRNPPSGFVVETHSDCTYVGSSENIMVLIDDCQRQSCRGKVVFHNSLGR